MPDDAHLSTEQLPSLASLVPLAGLPVALQIFFDQTMFERCKSIARYMADAKGFIPAHLAGNPSACFAVMSRALTWKLDPFAVAQATYEVGGRVGYYGSLCQAIMESSGRLVGGVKFTYIGDWKRVQRKFKIVETTNQYNKTVKTPHQLWTDEDEADLGVIVSAQIKDEAEPRELEFWMGQAYPRNSTLWITDPMTQIRYTSVRRFANTVAPTLFMGVPFDRDEITDWADSLKDVTPARRPQPEDYVNVGRAESGGQPEANEAVLFIVVDLVGEAKESSDPGEAADWFRTAQDEAEKQKGDIGVQAVWESNGRFIYDLRDRGHNDIADELAAYYAERLANSEQHDTRPDNAQPPVNAAGGAPTNAGGQPPIPQTPSDGAQAVRRQPDPQPAERRTTEKTDNDVPREAAPQASSPPGERPSLVVSPLQSEKGKTDWNVTAEAMVALIQSRTDLVDVMPLPNGRFRQDNREILERMRTADHDSWVLVEYALGSQMRTLQIDKK